MKKDAWNNPRIEFWQVVYEKLLEKYNTLADLHWRELEADYIYYGPWERQLSKLALRNDQDLISIYDNSEVEIYKIKK